MLTQSFIGGMAHLAAAAKVFSSEIPTKTNLVRELNAAKNSFSKAGEKDLPGIVQSIIAEISDTKNKSKHVDEYATWVEYALRTATDRESMLKNEERASKNGPKGAQKAERKTNRFKRKEPAYHP
jgi:hypothetical protein